MEPRLKSTLRNLSEFTTDIKALTNSLIRNEFSIYTNQSTHLS